MQCLRDSLENRFHKMKCSAQFQPRDILMYHNLVTRAGSPFATSDVGIGLNARDWA